MSRALKLVVCAAVLCAASQASARRAACDDDDEGPLSLPVDLLRSPIQEAAWPVFDDPRPTDATRVCVAGATNDPSCRPLSSLPSGGRTVVGSLFSDSFVLVRAPAVPPADARLLSRPTETVSPLAPGHARRAWRPPRASSISA